MELLLGPLEVCKVEPVVPLVVELQQELRNLFAAADDKLGFLGLVVAEKLLHPEDVKVLGYDRLRVK